MYSPSSPTPGSSSEGKEIDTDRDEYVSWLDEVEGKLLSSGKMLQISEKVRIFRVPKPIIMCNQESYLPSVISLGPYHLSKNPELSPIDLHKQEAVRRVLKRLNIGLRRLLEVIQHLESEIRELYEEHICLDQKNLCYMLALDASFILEFFRGEVIQDSLSLIFQPLSNATRGAILCDILKVENQIPLSVILRILELECTDGGHSAGQPGTRADATEKLARMLVTHLVFRGFPFSVSSTEDAASKLKGYMTGGPPPWHLLDMYRMVIRDVIIDPTTQHAVNISNPVASDGSRSSSPRAELLEMSGIKFHPGPLGFRKGRFGTGLLSLPEIRMADITETLLHNVMAYEECQRCLHTRESTIISHFVKFLDDLIDSEKDVVVLRKSLVLESHIGSDEEISRIFNRLCYGITVGKFNEIEG